MLNRTNISEQIEYDAITIATNHDLSEIEHELERRRSIRDGLKSPLYTCDEDTLERAVQLYNEPSVRSEREAILQSVAELNQRDA